MADWIRQRTLDEALAVFEEAGVAAAPIYDAEQLLGDPQLRARGVYPSVPTRNSAQCGSRRRFPLLGHPGRVAHLGPRLGADTPRCTPGCSASTTRACKTYTNRE